MTLLFQWTHLKDRNKALTFDDVLILPQKSEISSRKDPILRSRITKNHYLDLPFISANMDTITESHMAHAMDQNGGCGILHRFMSIEDQVKQVHALKGLGVNHVAASVGVNSEDRQRAQALVSAGATILTVDIAHGHSELMLNTLKGLKDRFSDVDVIAGNVSTPQGTLELINAGADAIKVGIGPGAMCTTRIITGCGLPQLTAIALCSEVAREKNIPVIADGGLRTSGDIVKAFAAGAETVMLGSMLSGSLETPGDILRGQKQYRGMASRSAQNSWRGGVPRGMAPEGEATQVPVKGPVENILLELSGGLRSGMTYINANSIEEIRHKAAFTEVSAMGRAESHAHGLHT